jgi:hypothetical protein
MALAGFVILGGGCRSQEIAHVTGDAGKPIHLGDTLEWVTATHGLPDDTYLFPGLDEKILVYGSSFVRMKHDKLFKWENYGDLSLEPGAPSRNSVAITQGSLLQDIISTHGEPDDTHDFEAKEEVMLIYGHSWIRLRRGSVQEWHNEGDLFVFDRHPQTLPESGDYIGYALEDGVVNQYEVSSPYSKDSVMGHVRHMKPVIRSTPWPGWQK